MPVREAVVVICSGGSGGGALVRLSEGYKKFDVGSDESRRFTLKAGERMDVTRLGQPAVEVKNDLKETLYVENVGGQKFGKAIPQEDSLMIPKRDQRYRFWRGKKS